MERGKKSLTKRCKNRFSLLESNIWWPVSYIISIFINLIRGVIYKKKDWNTRNAGVTELMQRNKRKKKKKLLTDGVSLGLLDADSYIRCWRISSASLFSIILLPDLVSPDMFPRACRAACNIICQWYHQDTCVPYI